jgi:DNA (cytosine-5)-methyltransferase 1
MTVNQRSIAVDLFAGAGGMTLGFEQAGFDVLASVEIDPIHCAIHKFNFPDRWATICKSVTDISGSEIRNQSKIQDQEIDVVFGGSPCQGFSLIGKRALNDPRNSLVFHFMRLVQELQPKYFVLENVKGLTIGKHRQFLAEVIAEFEHHGYVVETKYRVLNAVNYGVPQSRERLFLLGCRQGLHLPSYPLPITKSPQLTEKIPPEFLNLPNAPTVWDAIADLPDIEQYPDLISRDFCIAEYGDSISEYSQIMRGLKRSPLDHSYQRQWDSNLLTSSLRTKHNQESIQRFANTASGKAEPISRFHRLDYNDICNTLRAGTPSNRGAFTSPRPIHPTHPRCITVREAARLHSYPDWFRFHHTKWHGFRQIGNSVPPLLARAVASQLIKVLEIHPHPPKQNLIASEEKLLRLNMTEAAKEFKVDRHTIAPRIKLSK